MKTIELKITETFKGVTGKYVVQNTIKETFETISELKEYLIKRYGKLPKGRRKIYNEDKNGEVITVGFLYSCWTYDYLDGTNKKWYQTDWIEFYQQETIKTYFKL